MNPVAAQDAWNAKHPQPPDGGWSKLDFVLESDIIIPV